MISDRISDDMNMVIVLQSRLKLERCESHKAARHPTKCDLLLTSNYFQQYIAGYTVANV